MKTVLYGVRTRHLRIDEVTIPHRAFTVIVGPSGSGKSTLLLDTLHAEARRRLDELVAVDRQKLVANVARPPIDRALGLLPTLAHAREFTGLFSAKTLGSLTAIEDAVALLAARVGNLACPQCSEPMASLTADAYADAWLAEAPGGRVTVMAPLVILDGALRESLLTEGWVRVRVHGKLVALEEFVAGQPADLVIDRIALRDGVRGRLVDAIELAWRLGNGSACVARENADDLLISQEPRCHSCTITIPRMTPEDLVCSSPRSRCDACEGTGLVSALDHARAVDMTRSLQAGAVRAWGSGTTAGAKALIQSLAKAHGLTTTVALSSLDEKAVSAALGGPGDSEDTFTVLRELLTREAGGESDLPGPASFLRDAPCPSCAGTGRSLGFRAHRLGAHRLTELEAAPLSMAAKMLLEGSPSGPPEGRFKAVWTELHRRLETASRMGLAHLSLRRRGHTLSRGELQRARLVAQMGAPLESVMHLLDEPTDGLHPLDAQSVLEAIRALITEGATVVAIAHDPLTIARADHAIVLGPGAGKHGGRLLDEGEPRRVVPRLPTKARAPSTTLGAAWKLTGCTIHELKGMPVHIPQGAMVTFTGVSGSGKSTLLRDGLAVAAEARRFDFPAPFGHGTLVGPPPTSVVLVDDRPLARSQRSTVASAIGVLDGLREAYANAAESRARGYGIARFSYNLRGGRCERCEGTGLEPGGLDRFDTMPCTACNGLRFNRETSEIRVHGHALGELLALPVMEVAAMFRGNMRLASRLDALTDLGLGYLPLGQSTITLSSGEAKRIVLARVIARADLQGALVLLDEPTSGLSADDVESFLSATGRLRSRGATLVVAEHRAAVMAASDWIVELGPGAGRAGGNVVVEGTLETVLACRESVTRRALELANANDGYD